jgi:hypothetical protein
MSEAEFERRQTVPMAPEAETVEDAPEVVEAPRAASSGNGSKRSAARGKGVKSRRVQRMFAIEEDVDKKLWLYAIHVGRTARKSSTTSCARWWPRWCCTTPATADRRDRRRWRRRGKGRGVWDGR